MNSQRIKTAHLQIAPANARPKPAKELVYFASPDFADTKKLNLYRQKKGMTELELISKHCREQRPVAQHPISNIWIQVVA